MEKKKIEEFVNMAIDNFKNMKFNDPVMAFSARFLEANLDDPIVEEGLRAFLYDHFTPPKK